MNRNDCYFPALKSQRDSSIQKERIGPIIYIISKIPRLLGTRSCSIGRTRNSNGGSVAGCQKTKYHPVHFEPPLEDGIMNESERGRNGCREKRESDSSLSSLSSLNGTERKIRVVIFRSHNEADCSHHLCRCYFVSLLAPLCAASQQ